MAWAKLKQINIHKSTWRNEIQKKLFDLDRLDMSRLADYFIVVGYDREKDRKSAAW